MADAGASPSGAALDAQLLADVKRSSVGASQWAQFSLGLYPRIRWGALDFRDRERVSGFVERLDCDARAKALYHAAFGDARLATHLFLRLVLEASGAGIGVCRALVELARGRAACTPDLLLAAAELLRAAPSLAPLCGAVLSAPVEVLWGPADGPAEQQGWRQHPLVRRDPQRLFHGDDAFLKGVLRLCGEEYEE